MPVRHARRPHGGEHLEARDARLDGLADLVDARLGDLAEQDVVEREVRVRVSGERRSPRLDVLRDRRVGAIALCGGEVNDRRHAAEHGGEARCLGRLRVDVSQPARPFQIDALGDVRVRLDPAREHDQTLGIDLSGAALGQRAGLRDGRDLLPLDPDVEPGDRAGRHDPPAANDQIQHAHFLRAHILGPSVQAVVSTPTRQLWAGQDSRQPRPTRACGRPA